MTKLFRKLCVRNIVTRVKAVKVPFHPKNEDITSSIVRMAKEMSDIKFVLLLMMTHKTSEVPKSEINKITDSDILLLFDINKESLLNRYIEINKKWTLMIGQYIRSQTPPPCKFISISLYYLFIFTTYSECYISWISC